MKRRFYATTLIMMILVTVCGTMGSISAIETRGPVRDPITKTANKNIPKIVTWVHQATFQPSMNGKTCSTMNKVTVTKKQLFTIVTKSTVTTNSGFNAHGKVLVTGNGVIYKQESTLKY